MYLFGVGLDPHPESQLVYCKWMLSISHPSSLSSEKSSFHPAEDKDLTMKQLLQWSPQKSMSEQWSIVVFKLWSTPKLGENDEDDVFSPNCTKLEGGGTTQRRSGRKKRGLNWGSSLRRATDGDG